MAGIESWLRGLGHEGLSTLLLQRPDVMRSHRQLRTLNAVAAELLRPESTWRALAALDGLTTGVAEALTALGKVAHRSELGDFIGEPEHVASDDVNAALERLQRLCLAWSDEPGMWNVSAGLRAVFQHPFGLGPTLHQLLRGYDERSLRIVASTIGVPRIPSRTVLQATVESRLRDPEAVRTIAAGAPREAAAVLHTLTWHNRMDGLVRTFPTLFRYDGDEEYHGGAPTEYAAMQAVVDWLRRNGFVIPSGGFEHMPREVALALRGERWLPPVQRQPPVTTVAVNAEAVRGDAAAAAAQVLRDMSLLLTALAEQPASVLRSPDAGVGVREVKRLAKKVGVDTWRAELLLVLGAGLGLLERRQDDVTAAATAGQWLQLDPARQLVDLLRQWWHLEASPTHRVDAYSGKPRPVLAFGPTVPNSRRLRRSVVAVLADLPGGQGTTGPDGALPAAVWRTPIGMPAPLLMDDAAAAVWREAHALGVLAVDSAAPLGRALAARGAVEEELLREASALLPPVSTTAVFQSDLTAIVEGVASAQLTDLLSSCAVQETSGTVSRWRLGDASVRTAMDAGTTASGLLDQLADAASKPLPQPLRYLIEDVGRRHGHLRVTNVRCVVVSSDDVLLTQIQHERRLAVLSLRRLAPTVLASGKHAAETVEALRRAGFMPVLEGADGSVSVERRPKVGQVSAKQAALTGLGSAVAAFAREEFGEEFDLQNARDIASLVLQE